LRNLNDKIEVYWQIEYKFVNHQRVWV